MREQSGKKLRILGALLILLAVCVIRSITVKAETLEDQAVQTVRFGEFDEFSLKGSSPTVIKIVLKEKGSFELDFSPKEFIFEGQLYDEQSNDLGSWSYHLRSTLSSSTLDAGTYYIRLWDQYNRDACTYTYFAKFKSTSDSSIEICIPLKKGKSVQLGTIFTNSKDKKVTWSSSKSSVATVSASGKVTAKKKGTAIIKVFNSSGHVSKIKVKVTG